MRSFVPLAALPLALAVLAFGLLMVDLDWSGLSGSSWRLLPYGLCASSFALGWAFHHTRFAFLALFLALLTLIQTTADLATPPAGPACLIALVLTPCLAVVFCRLPERGLWNSHGVLRAGLVLGSAALVYLPFLVHRLLLGPTPGQAPPLLHPQAVATTGVLTLLLGTVFLLARRHDRALLVPPLLAGTIALLDAGLYVAWRQPGQPVFFLFATSAGLVFLLAVLAGSWRSAFLDELTQLPGRRMLRHHLASLTPPYTLALLDIDHFKQINDRYGHETGDQVLRFLAARLRDLPCKHAYRYGGEEFVVLFPGLPLHEAVRHLESLRTSITERPFVRRAPDRPWRKPRAPRPSTRHETLPLTVSLGVAQSAARESDPAEILRRADHALYRAKEGGRNRIELARA